MIIATGATASDDGPQQTVEGAQTFLSQVLPGQGYMPGFFTDAVTRASRQRNLPRPQILGEGKIYQAAAIRKCVSTLRFDMSPVYIAYGRERVNFVRTFSPELAQGGIPEGFSWGDVVEVNRIGSRVDLTFKGNRDASRIHLNAETLARRVAYAIEFLRLHCDETAKTGF